MGPYWIQWDKHDLDQWQGMQESYEETFPWDHTDDHQVHTLEEEDLENHEEDEE